MNKASRINQNSVLKQSSSDSPDREQGLFDEEAAASLVEYALLVSLIAIVCFTAIVFLGNSTSESLQDPDLLGAFAAS